MSITFTANDNLDGVQFSTSNAVAVLAALGLPAVDEYGEVYGEVPGDDFHARVLVALATDPQEASPGYRDGGWIEVGRSSTYMQDRLPELAELARGAERVRWV